MDGTGADEPLSRPSGGDGDRDVAGEDSPAEAPPGVDEFSLEELAARLERDPEESWLAFQGLEAIEAEARIRIIEGLSRVCPGRGVASLVRLLIASPDPATQEAATVALAELRDRDPGLEGDPGTTEPELETEGEDLPCPVEPGAAAGSSRDIVPAGDAARPRLVRCLVTAVDGAGQGAIAVSASQGTERRTAVFVCEVERGIIDVIGQIDAEGPSAGGLLEGDRFQSGGFDVLDAPELALGLLAGSLLLTGGAVSRLARDWLEQTLGSGFEPRLLPAPSPDRELTPMGPAELHERASEVLEACPDWLDSSPLTFELAEEILLREGRVAADPQRDSGAFRYLFQHRLIDRLELYRRMLLWMAWFWTYGGEPELARSAHILAGQLSDEQHAVPAHPFAEVLLARSLDAARAGLGTEADPRPSGRRR